MNYVIMGQDFNSDTSSVITILKNDLQKAFIALDEHEKMCAKLFGFNKCSFWVEDSYNPNTVLVPPCTN